MYRNQNPTQPVQTQHDSTQHDSTQHDSTQRSPVESNRGAKAYAGYTELGASEVSGRSGVAVGVTEGVQEGQKGQRPGSGGAKAYAGYTELGASEVSGRSGPAAPPLLIAVLMGSLSTACQPLSVNTDAGPIFDTGSDEPPAAPVLLEAYNPVPWPIATVRGTAVDARRVLVRGPGKPVSVSTQSDGSFCFDANLQSQGLFEFELLAQNSRGLVSENALYVTVEHTDNAPFIQNATTCSGGSPTGCSGTVEICGNGRDDDCDGATDDADSECQSCDDDVLEENDNITAPIIETPAAFNSLNLCDDDYYGILANAGDTIVATVSYSGSGNIDIQLIDVNTSTVLVTAATNGSEQISFTVEAGGRHALRVYSPQNDQIFYTLTLSVSPAADS
ncbi:MAG: PPC domain-containing protein [Myxococcota bacterium]